MKKMILKRRKKIGMTATDMIFSTGTTVEDGFPFFILLGCSSFPFMPDLISKTLFVSMSLLA